MRILVCLILLIIELDYSATLTYETSSAIFIFSQIDSVFTFSPKRRHFPNHLQVTRLGKDDETKSIGIMALVVIDCKKRTHIVHGVANMIWGVPNMTIEAWGAQHSFEDDWPDDERYVAYKHACRTLLQIKVK